MYNHFSDNIPVMLLKSWPAESVLFDGDIMDRPVPSLFSENLESFAENFETAPPRTSADVCVEVMAQVRPNGRVMDHWRIATGGLNCVASSGCDLVEIFHQLWGL